MEEPQPELRTACARHVGTGGQILTGAGIALAVGAVHYFTRWNPIALPPGNPVSVNAYVLAAKVDPMVSLRYD